MRSSLISTSSRYEYDLTEIDRCVHLLREALPPAELFYSIKANPHPAIVRRCVQQGLSLEVSSVGELEIALDCCDGEIRIVCTGPGKSDAYLNRAVQVQAVISVESEDEIRRLNRLGMIDAVDVLVRVNANTQSRNASLQMTGVASQFGIDEDRAESAVQAIRRGPHRFRGVHLYMGSNISNEDDLIQQYRIGMAIAKRLAPYAETDFLVDLGGGFGHPFAHPGTTPHWPTLRQRLLSLIMEYEASDWQLAFESGRYLVAACGTLVLTVQDVKASKNTQYAIASSGINHLGGMSGLRRVPAVRAIGECEAGTVDPETRIHLVGPLCTPVDILSPNMTVSVQIGDEIRIPNVGAYGLSASLANFLSHPYPAEVILESGNIVSITRQRVIREEVINHV